MNCPKCGEDTIVTDTKASVRQLFVWRRRKCKVCGDRFTTYEKPREGTSVLDAIIALRAMKKRLLEDKTDSARVVIALECGLLAQHLQRFVLSPCDDCEMENGCIVQPFTEECKEYRSGG